MNKKKMTGAVGKKIEERRIGGKTKKDVHVRNRRENQIDK